MPHLQYLCYLFQGQCTSITIQMEQAGRHGPACSIRAMRLLWGAKPKRRSMPHLKLYVV
jgi:hypothetical protein